MTRIKLAFAVTLLIVIALVVAPAVARGSDIKIIQPDDTIFLWEEDLNISGLIDNGSISSLRKLIDFDFSNLISVTNPLLFDVPSLEDENLGIYHAFNGIDYGYSVIIDKPELGLDVFLATDNVSSINSKSVSENTDIQFKIQTSKVGDTYFNSTGGQVATVMVEVIPEGGAPLTNFGNQNLGDISVISSNIYIPNIDLNAEEPGLYTAKVEWTSPQGFADYAPDSNSVSFTILSDNISLPVHNLDSGLTYPSIQAAIDDPDTMEGDTILVDSGTYFEKVNVTKRLALRGNDIGGGLPVVDAQNIDNPITVSSDHVTIEGFVVIDSVQNYGAGIYITSDNNTITHNIAYSNGVGIYLANGRNNTISENEVSDNLGWEYSGIYLYFSEDNTISDNTIINNVHGIHLQNSNGNIITKNTIFEGYYGILIGNSNGNIIQTNEVSNAELSIRLFSSSNNVVYNNIFDNASDDGTDTWNITKIPGTNIIGGSWLGGNYWSDYTGSDSDEDGLGDTPYSIQDGSNQDDLPLVFVSAEGTLIANFTSNITSGFAPLEVQFNDTSTGNHTIWNWSFGDGTYSDEQNPVHIYTAPGNYTINFTVSNDLDTNSLIKNEYITVIQPETWYFDSGEDVYDGWTVEQTYSAPSTFPHVYTTWGDCNASGIVILDACSSSYQEIWNNIKFPNEKSKLVLHIVKPVDPSQYLDGGFRLFIGVTSFDPVLIPMGFDDYLEYQIPESFQGTTQIVRLRSISSSGLSGESSCYGEHIGIDEIAIEYIADNPVEPFLANITGIVFEDANADGVFHEENPISGALLMLDRPVQSTCFTDSEGVCTFFESSPGTYNLSISTPVGWYVTTPTMQCVVVNESSDYVVMFGIAMTPVADFIADPVLGYAPLIVNFSDRSSGNSTTWNWSFGDGEYSDEQNPTHIYPFAGNYSVSLTVSNGSENDTVIKEQYITVEPLLPNAELIFNINYNRGTTNDTIASGMSLGRLVYFTGVYNPADSQSISGNLSFVLDAPSIIALIPDIYGELNGTLATWQFPPSTAIDPGATLSTTARTSVLTPQTSGVTLERICNRTTFAEAGDQLVTLHMTFDTIDLDGLWGRLECSETADVRPAFIPGTISTDLPLVKTMEGSERVQFTINHSQVETGRQYTLSYAVAVDPFRPVAYAPSCAIWEVTDAASTTAPSGTSVSLPASLLPESVTNVEFSSETLCQWSCSRNYHIVTSISQRAEQIPEPVANFTADVTSGNAPLEVQFTDTSTGNPTVWNWSFGDETYSDMQNPLHMYTAPGTYSVSLTASNGAGSNMTIKTGYINVQGEVTIAVAGPGSYYLGETLSISGTNSQSETTYLFITGDGLDPEGVSLSDISLNVSEGYFTEVPVNPDQTWSFQWDTSVAGDLATESYGNYSWGSYPPISIYAVADSVGASGITGHAHATQELLFYRPFVAAQVQYSIIDRGDAQIISGFAEGDPDHVYVWMFGPLSRLLGIPVPVESDGTFEFILDSVTTQALSGGQYFAFIQHPGVNHVPEIHPDYETNPNTSFINDTGYSVDLSNTGPLEGARFVTDSVRNAASAGISDDSYTKLIFHIYAEYGESISTSLVTGWNSAYPDWYIINATAGDPLVVNVTTSWSDGPLVMVNSPDIEPTQYTSATNTIELTFSVNQSGTFEFGIDDNGRDDGGPYTIEFSNVVNTLPAADFSAWPLYGNAPLSVTFSDLSTGNPTLWNWSFGDGAYSDEENPVHVYSASGTYTVSLTASNEAGINTTIKAGCIVVSEPLPDWNDWQYNEQIIITENSGSDLTDYQVLIKLNASNFDFFLAQPDGADIRFSDLEEMPLPYWIEEWDLGMEQARVWVNVPFIPAFSGANITIYYGNPIATSESDGDATFEFFDDLGDSLNWNFWGSPLGYLDMAAGNPLPSIRGYGDGNYWSGAVSKQGFSYGNGVALTFDAKQSSDLRRGCGGFGQQSAYTTSDWFYGPLKGIAYVQMRYNELGQRAYCVSTANATEDLFIENWNDQTWHQYRIGIEPGYGNVHFFEDGNLKWVSEERVNSYTQGYITLAGHDPEFWYDNIIVSGYTYPEPSVSFNQTQSPIIANFNASPTSGPAPLDVQFTDLSTGNPTSWNWSFGDGATSTDQHPVHTYSIPGTYTVNLTAANSKGSNTLSWTGYITANAAGPIFITGPTVIATPGHYALQNSITDSHSTCIWITTSDVIFDGMGYTIDGVDTFGTYGVFVHNGTETLSNVTVRNLTVTDWGYGIHYINATESRLENIQASSNGNGIDLRPCSNSSLENITASDNDSNGITLFDSSTGNILTRIATDYNKYAGIMANGAHHTRMLDVQAIGNIWLGIYFYGGGDDSVVENARSENNQYGISVWYSRNVTIANSTIRSNSVDGIELLGATECLFYNNLLNNSVNVGLDGDSVGNTWNVSRSAGTNVIWGSWIGGNYWADPSGTGHSETAPDFDGDGICDLGYDIGGGNIDYLPLGGIMVSLPSALFTASPTVGPAPLTVTFNDTSTGDIDEWNWDFGDGNTSSTQNTSYEYPTPGIYTFSLTVTGPGGSDSSSSEINVTEPQTPNNPPVPNAGGPYTAPEGSPITFDASASSDPDEDSIQFRWDFESDGAWDTPWTEPPTADYTWLDDYEGMVTLEVSDGIVNVSDTATVTVTNLPPVVSAGENKTAETGTTVLFNGTATDPGTEDVLSILWSFGDNTSATDTLSPSHTYASPGTYSVTLTVSDDDGGMDTDTTTVTVTELVLPPSAQFTASPTVGPAPLTVTFTDLSTGNPTTWNWSFGDETYSTEKDPAHVYTEPGIYSVTLEVSNPLGNSTKTEPELITVEPGAVGGQTGYYLIYSNIDGASVYFTDNSNETYYAGEIENGSLNATVYLTATPLISYTVEKEGYLSYTGLIETPPAPGENVELPSKLYSAYSQLDFEVPGVTIVMVMNGESRQYIEIDPSQFTPDSILIEGDDVIITDPELQFPEIIYHLSGMVVDQNISGYLEGADFTSPALSAMLEDGETVEPSFAMSFDLLPESGSIGIGILEGEQTEEAQSFFGFADSQGTPLDSLKYVVEVDSASLGGELGGVNVYFRADLDWVEAYGTENVKIYRCDNTGSITVLATEVIETTETAVIFRGYSPDGLSIFAIAAERPPAYDYSGDGGDSGDSRSSKDESSQETELPQDVPPAEEPPVIEPELLSELPVQQIPEQILPQTEPLITDSPLSPADALISEISRISSITPGDYFTGLASSVETATKTNYVQSPVAQALPKEACPVAAVATGIGVAGLGAALTGTAAFSLQGTAGTAADAMMGARVPSATSQMARVQQAARPYVQRLASRTWRSPGISQRIDRAWEFIRKFLGFETIGYLGLKEVQWRKILPRSHEPTFFGLSYRELAFSGISIGLLATAFTFAGRMNVSMTTVFLFILMGAIAVIGHELITNIIARQNQCDSEFLMWGLGALILFANAGLFGLAFGKPSRTLVAGTQHLSNRDRGTLMLIGPLVNVIFALISLYLIPLGGLLGAAGAIGFPINIMLGLYVLIPVHPMKGKIIFQWNRLVWAIFFVPLVILYISVYYLF